MDSLKSVSGRSNGFTPIRCIIFAAAAAAVVFALLSVMSADSSEADVAYSGTSGEVTWTFDPDTGKLEFSGSGNMTNKYKDRSYIHLAESIKTIVIGDSVTSVGDDAFQGCTGLTSVTIPDSVTYIGYCAFEKCKSLTSIYIPDSVTYIGAGVFKNCESLLTITVGSGNTSYCTVDGVLYNKDVTSLITYPAAKADVTFETPLTVTSIEAYSFSNSKALKNVIISDSVRSIGGWAFQYVYPDRITMPFYLKEIHGHAFCHHDYADNHFLTGRSDFDFDGIIFYNDWGYLVEYNVLGDDADLRRFPGYIFVIDHGLVYKGKYTYEVKFTAYDGSFLKTARYIKGDTSVIEPANSSAYGYVYSWPEYTLGEEHINVREIRTPVEYTVSFDANGGTGTMDPVKTNIELFSEPENKFGIPEEHMHFDGWSLTPGGEKIDFSNFKLDNVTLYARWAWDQYKITFVVEGSVYEEKLVDYGGIIPSPPVVFDIKLGMYTVTGCKWEGYDDYLFMPACNLEFNAVLTKTYDQHSVMFISEGKIVSKYVADYGSEIILPEDVPVKEADSKYTYTFALWGGYSNGMTVPNHNVRLVAQYTCTPIEYTVKFISEGTVVGECKAGYGTAVILPTDPVKASDSKYTYTFVSWDGYSNGMTVPDYDIELTAQFRNTPVKYNVKFTSDGNTVSEYTADYGSLIALPENPSKAPSSRYTYSFVSWKGYTEGMTVPDSDITFEARFAATVIPSYNLPVTPVEPQKETTTVIEETNTDDGSSKITVSSSESSVVTVVEKPKDGVVSAESSAEVTTVIVSDSVVTEAVSKLTEVSDKYDAEEKAVVIESDENELTLSSSALAAVVDADASTEFRGETGTLKFSKEAAETLVSSGESITLSLSHADDSALTESQKSQIGNARVFTLKASAGESAVSSFAGTVTVTLPYELPEGKTADDVFVYYLNDSGEFVSVASSYDVSSQTVTFKTDHFSCWTVTDIKLQSAEESEEDQTVSPILIAVIVTVVCIAAFTIICVKRN